MQPWLWILFLDDTARSLRKCEDIACLVLRNFIPATYLVLGMQNIMLKGEGLLKKENELAVLVMLLTTVGGGLISMKLFRWEKEEKIRGSAKLWVLAVLTPFFAMGIWKWFQG